MTAPDRQSPADAVRRLTTDPGPWLSCDDCFRLVDRYVEGVLAERAAPDGEFVAMPAHLSGCSACAEEATTLLLLAAADAGVDPGPALGRLSAG
jgi:hypothetical protein